MPVLVVNTKGRVVTLQAYVKNFFLQTIISIFRVQKVARMGRMHTWLVLEPIVHLHVHLLKELWGEPPFFLLLGFEVEVLHAHQAGALAIVGHLFVVCKQSLPLIFASQAISGNVTFP
jgi:hypothetical protein